MEERLYGRKVVKGMRRGRNKIGMGKWREKENILRRIYI